MCVSQLKIKIFYKYTEPVCWWLFCFECSLCQAHFICCSDPIFCSHSLLAQLHSLAVCFSLGSWDGTAGFTSESAVVEQKHRKSLKQQMLVPSSPLFFFFFSFRFFHCACFKLLTHWCGERGFERLYRKVSVTVENALIFLLKVQMELNQ